MLANAIGSLFREAAAAGLIVKTGRARNSQQPHRKGGLVLEWVGAPAVISQPRMFTL